MTDAEWVRWRMRGHGKEAVRRPDGGAPDVRVGDVWQVYGNHTIHVYAIEPENGWPVRVTHTYPAGTSAKNGFMFDAFMPGSTQNAKLISRAAPAEKVGWVPKVGDRVRVAASFVDSGKWGIGIDCTVAGRWNEGCVLTDCLGRQAWTYEKNLELVEAAKP